MMQRQQRRAEDLAKDRVLEALRAMLAGPRSAERVALVAAFKAFTVYFFRRRKGVQFLWVDELHGRVAEALIDVYVGATTFLIVNGPPRYGKTELLIAFMAWTKQRNPRCNDMHLSYSEPLAAGNSEGVREIVKSAEFQILWPHIGVKPHQDSKQAWMTAQGGLLYAQNAGGAVTGFGAGVMDDSDPATGAFVYSGALHIDDPIKPDDAKSEVERKKINDRWDETIKSRRNSQRTPVVLWMQRLAPDDFTGMFLAHPMFQWSEAPGSRCRLLRLQALIDEGLPTERALFPFKETAEQLRAERDSGPNAAHIFATQKQQAPRTRGGNLIKGVWLPRWSLDGRQGTVRLPQLRRRIIFADTAQKTGERNDYTVFHLVGEGVDDNAYSLDLVRGKWGSPDLIRVAYRFWVKHLAGNRPHHGGQLYQMRVEDKSSGTGLVQSLQRPDPNYRDKAAGIVGRKAIPVSGIERSKDKFTRCTDSQDLLFQGRLRVPAPDPETGLWLWPSSHPVDSPTTVGDLVEELEAFTADDTHAHDDQADTVWDVCAECLIKPGGFIIPAGVLDRARQPAGRRR